MRNYFATADEVESSTVRVGLSDAIRCLNQGGSPEAAMHMCPVGGPVVRCGEGGTAYVMGEDSHSITFASTGRGKSRRFVLPTVMTDILSGTNLVVNDMKGEIYTVCRSLLVLMGYTTYVLDLRNPKNSPNRYNPLLLAWDKWHAGDEDAAFRRLRDFGSSIFGEQLAHVDPFWDNTSKDYFVGLTTGALEAGVSRDAFTLESVAVMDRVGECCEMGESYLDRMFDCFPVTSIALQNVSGTLRAPSKTRQSILSTFRQPITLYTSQMGLMDMLCRSDFSVEDFARERRALFIISPDETHSLGPIVVGILNQIMSGLITYAQDSCGGILPHRVDFILDEMGNLPKRVPDLEALVSAARSRNIRFHFVLQSIDQLTNVYGQELKSVILDNCDTLVFMGSKGLPFLRYISELAGTVRLESGEERPLLSVDKLQRLEKRKTETEALVFLSNLRPYVTALKDYCQYERPVQASGDERTKEPVDHELFDITAVRKTKDGRIIYRKDDEFHQDDCGTAYINDTFDSDTWKAIESKFDELFGSDSQDEG